MTMFKLGQIVKATSDSQGLKTGLMYRIVEIREEAGFGGLLVQTYYVSSRIDSMSRKTTIKVVNAQLCLAQKG